MTRKKLTRKSKIEVKIKDFGQDKKSRKGKYYYVKEKGRIGKYYKVKKGVTERTAKEFYKRGLVTKRGGLSEKRVKKERKLYDRDWETPFLTL